MDKWLTDCAVYVQSAGPNGELHIFAVEDEGGRSSVPAITPITSPVLRLVSLVESSIMRVMRSHLSRRE